MTGVNDLAKLVPGFEFLQGLMKTAGAGMPGVPGMGQWVAPTLNPEELDKRIQELKTVQFWLDNNAKLLGATIQALEVQRMTLSTLQTMNLPMADLREALRIKLPDSAPAPASAGADRAADRADDPAAGAAPASGQRGGRQASDAAAPAAIDPMQWWGALTQQFTELAARAVKDASVGSSADSGDAGVGRAPAPARKGSRKTAATARTPRKTR